MIKFPVRTTRKSHLRKTELKIIVGFVVLQFRNEEASSNILLFVNSSTFLLVLASHLKTQSSSKQVMENDIHNCVLTTMNINVE